MVDRAVACLVPPYTSSLRGCRYLGSGPSYSLKFHAPRVVRASLDTQNQDMCHAIISSNLIKILVPT